MRTVAGMTLNIGKNMTKTTREAGRNFYRRGLMLFAICCALCFGATPLQAAVTASVTTGVLTVNLGAANDVATLTPQSATSVQVSGTGFATQIFSTLTDITINYGAANQTVTFSGSTALTLTGNFTTNDISNSTGEALTFTNTAIATFKYVMIFMDTNGPVGNVSFNGPVTGTGLKNASGTLSGANAIVAQASTLTVTQPITTTNSGIALLADSMTLSAAVNAGTNDVDLSIATANLFIDIGTNPSAGKLGLAQSDLNQVTAGILRIGNGVTFSMPIPGGITVSAPITNGPNWSSLWLLILNSSTGTISQLANDTLSVSNLVVVANSASLTEAGNSIGQIAGSLRTSSTIVSSASMTVGTINTVSGLGTVNGGVLTLHVLGNNTLTINNAIDQTQQSLSGDVVLIADNMTFNASTSIKAGAGVVTLTTDSPTRPISLGQTTAGSLSLQDSDLGKVSTTSLLRIGSNATIPGNGVAANTGGIFIGGTIGVITPGNYNNTLSLITSGAISNGSNVPIQVPNVAMRASAASQAIKLLANSNGISNLAVSVDSGSVTIDNNSDMTIGTIDGITGVNTTTGAAFLISTNFGTTLTVTNPISTTNAQISLSFDAYAINAAVNAGTAPLTFTRPSDPSGFKLGTATAATGLTNAELDFLTAGVVEFGSNIFTGAIIIAGPVSAHPGYNTIYLNASGADGQVLSANSAATLTVANLLIAADSGIGSSVQLFLAGSTNLGFNNSFNGAVAISSTGTMTVKNVLSPIVNIGGGINGAPGGTIQLTASGANPIILAGTSGLKTLNANGTITLSPGTGGIQIAPSTVADETAISSNTFTSPAAPLSLTLSAAPTVGQKFTIVSNTAAAATPISGTFSNLAEGAILTTIFNGKTYNFKASYLGGDGNDLVLTNVLNESLVVTTTADENDGTSDPSFGNGTSLREAIAYAKTLTGPQIITFSNSTANGATNFSDGTMHTLTLGGTELAIDSNLTISGPGASALTISGNNASRAFDIGNIDSTVSVSIDGVTIAQGNSGNGGGVSSNCALTIINSAFTNNTAPTSDGGALYSNSSLTVIQTTFTNNTATGGNGGAIFTNGVSTLSSLTFTNNSGTGGLDGGAIFSNAPMTIADSSFTGNTVDGDGGAVFNNSQMKADNLTFSNNSTTGSFVSGGAMFNNGNLRATHLTFSGNSANGTSAAGGALFNNDTLSAAYFTISGNSVTGVNCKGGGFYNNVSGSLLTRSTISGNTANGGGALGGGIYDASPNTLTLTIVTIAGNSVSGVASQGGGAYSAGTTAISGSTISGNSATDGDAGGLGNGSGFTLLNTIVAGNTALSNPDIFGTINSDGNNLIGDTTGTGGFVASDLQNVSPLLGTLGNYGGPTQTIPLLPGSPAINAGQDLFQSEQQQITLGGSTTGTFTLTFMGQTTAPLAYFSKPGAVQAALEALTTIGAGNVSVSGSNPAYDVTFTGALANTDLSALIATGSGGTNAAVTTSVNGGIAPDQRGESIVSARDIGAFESQGFTFGTKTGTPQSATISSAFAAPLTVAVIPNNPGEPVDGGLVTFTPPTAGASLNPTTPITATIATGIASSGTATANATIGGYTVLASITNVTGTADFALTNTPVEPTISGTVANQPVNDNATIAPFSSTVIGDTNMPQIPLTVTVTLNDLAKGSITTLNGFTNSGGGVYTFSGLAPAATTALQRLVFTPTSNRIPPGQTETEQFTISVNPGFGTPITDNTTSVIIKSINDAPVLTSAPTATPNPANVNQSVQFNVAATDADTNSTLTYSWDFKDGTTSTLQNPTHTFTAPGSYAVTVIVFDGNGGSVSGSVTVTVNVVVGDPGDTDGDGFPNEIETALGSDPLNPASHPLGLPSPTTNAPLLAPNLRIQLNFAAANKDSIVLTGKLLVNGVFPINQILIADVGGVVKAFTLDARGKASLSKRETLRLSIGRARTSLAGSEANLRLQLAAGSFTNAFTDEGLTNVSAIRAPKVVNVTIIFLNTVFKATVPQSYTVRNSIGKTTTTK